MAGQRLPSCRRPALRVTLNKSDAARDAGFVFQDTWTPRALFGLLGAEDVSLEVTPDAATHFAALKATTDGVIRSFDQAEERLGRAMETMGADFRAGLTDLGDRIEGVANRPNDFTQALLTQRGGGPR